MTGKQRETAIFHNIFLFLIIVFFSCYYFAVVLLGPFQTKLQNKIIITEIIKIVCGWCDVFVFHKYRCFSSIEAESASAIPALMNEKCWLTGLTAVPSPGTRVSVDGEMINVWIAPGGSIKTTPTTGCAFFSNDMGQRWHNAGPASETAARL